MTVASHEWRRFLASYSTVGAALRTQVVMQSLFISYSRRDAPMMRRLAGVLQSAGYEVWVDSEKSRVGHRWREEIARALQNAEAFILLLSSHSTSSPEVQRELDLAGDLNLPILPVMLETLCLPEKMQYLLAGLHWTSLAGGFQEGAAQLLQALGEMERVGPKNYIWGISAEDVKQLPDLTSPSEEAAADQILRFVATLNDLSDKAHRQLVDRLKEQTEKEKQFQDESQRLHKQIMEMAGEIDALRKSSPESQAYKLLVKERRALVEKKMLLMTYHTGNKEVEAILEDMSRLRESKQALFDWLEEVRKSEEQALRNIFRGRRG